MWYSESMERELCGKWMPIAKENCARTLGHRYQCRTRVNLDRQNEHNKTDAGKDAYARYNGTAKGRLRNSRHWGTAKGMLTRMRSNAKQRGNR